MTLAMNRWGVAAAMLLAGVCAASADYVILPNDTRLEGQIERRRLDGTVIIRVQQGTTAARQELAKGAYKMAVCDPPPAEFGQAVADFRAKNFQAAIDKLEKVADDKSGQEIDKQCRYLIARALTQAGKAADAVQQFDKLAKIYGEEVRKDPQVAVEYAAALLAAKQHSKLPDVLDLLVKDASRPIAAKAQNLRGQMREQQGQIDAAIIDYMRTVVFFEKDGGEAVPEAMLRAAKALESKRDPRFKMLYKRLVDEYKDSPFAKEAAGKV